MSMMLYDCKVRLGGSLLNETPRRHVTAGEIMMLRGIHGSDAVLNIVEVDDDPHITKPELFDRLVHRYGRAKFGEGDDAVRVLPQVFPLGATQLPEALPESEYEPRRQTQGERKRRKAAEEFGEAG